MSKYREYINVKKLPPVPETIKPLPHNGQAQAVVIAGLNYIGEQGYLCPTISIISFDKEFDDLFGWSLCLGNPKFQDELYFFRTSGKEGVGSARGTEYPNNVVYFEAEVDAALATKEADLQKLDEVLAYVLPYISDEGPPPADGKSFEDMIVEAPTSATEHEEALLLIEQISSFFDQIVLSQKDEWDYWSLQDELNKKLQQSGIRCAWKGDPFRPDYNPELGIVEKNIGNRLVRVSFGLRKDGFTEPCAVVQIVNQS